jgi:hypothetical protein
VVNGAIAWTEMNARDILNPTNIIFDLRRFLGLPPDIPLHAGFAQPNLIVDIFYKS